MNPLNNKTNNLNLIIQELKSKVQNLENENKMLLQEKNINYAQDIPMLKNSFSYLIRKFDDHENEISSIKSALDEIMKIIQKDGKRPQESNKFNTNLAQKELSEKKLSAYEAKIFQEKEDYDLIYNYMFNKFQKKVKELILIYQATKEGDSSLKFHKNCDNKNNTICLFKTKQGRRFGGFTSQKWNSANGEYIQDPKAFLFSLDKKQIYPKQNKNNSIFCSANCGPCFGSELSEIEVYDENFLNNKANASTSESDGHTFNYLGDSNALSEDGIGKGIELVELEVYQVIFE